MDCPTESHVQELLSKEYLNGYYEDISGPPEISKVVTCIIHLSPTSIVSSPNYQKWMKRFGSAQHIMAGHERFLFVCLLVYRYLYFFSCFLEVLVITGLHLLNLLRF